MVNTLSTNVKLTVCVTTYNHEKYIAQCLDSILAQKTNFDFKIHVLEDCSTDQTLNIIRAYQKKYPEKICLFSNARNLGATITFFEGYKTLRGNYIAFVEGDDYWTNANKLQKQVDFLDANPNFVGCGHDTQLLYEDKEKSAESMCKIDAEKVFTVDDYTRGLCYLHNSSMVYRHVFHDGLPEIFLDEQAGDWLLQIIHAERGDIKYFPGVMSVYRIHSEGVWSKLDEATRVKKNLLAAIYYNKALNYRHRAGFNQLIFRVSSHYLQILRKEKVGYREMVKYFWMKQKYRILGKFFDYFGS